MSHAANRLVETFFIAYLSCAVSHKHFKIGQIPKKSSHFKAIPIYF